MHSIVLLPRVNYNSYSWLSKVTIVTILGFEAFFTGNFLTTSTQDDEEDKKIKRATSERK